MRGFLAIGDSVTSSLLPLNDGVRFASRREIGAGPSTTRMPWQAVVNRDAPHEVVAP
jgi:hypothetical protein